MSSRGDFLSKQVNIFGMNINSNNSRVFIDARPQKNMVQNIGGEMQIRQMLARMCGTVY